MLLLLTISWVFCFFQTKENWNSNYFLYLFILKIQLVSKKVALSWNSDFFKIAHSLVLDTDSDSNSNRDRDFSICWDKLLKSVEIFSTVNTNFKIILWIFLSRSSRLSRWIEIVKIFQNESRFLKKSQLNQNFLNLKMRHLDKKYAKIHLLLDRDWDKLSRNDKISRS
jgi:hypothetical protein